MKWRFNCWLFLGLMSHIITYVLSYRICRPNIVIFPPIPPFIQIDKDGCECYCLEHLPHNPGISELTRCVREILCRLMIASDSEAIEKLEELEYRAQTTELQGENATIHVEIVQIGLYKNKSPFNSFKINANETHIMKDEDVAQRTVRVEVPGENELGIGSQNTMTAFIMITLPERAIWNSPGVLYENRMVGISVGQKEISGLRERVNIITTLTTAVEETEEPLCAFFNFSIQNYSTDGCITLWKRGDSHVTCSCDHLTFFAVLMVSAELSPTDHSILKYITIIGCSISLLALVTTVVHFTVNRHVSDVSMKVHINLAIALILLNAHFLPSEAVASQSSNELCLYLALLLHYSLLATFCWMAVEGFHLYRLLVKVFNIYVRHYILKLSLVGWGVPACIIALVIIADKSAYGRASIDISNQNGTEICYIRNETVKMATTLGLFALVFVFDLIMLIVAIKQLCRRELGQNDRDRTRRSACTLLGITTLLGIPWGLIFFSFGYLEIYGLYLFCVLNSLQGFFIFLWFVMSLRKIRNTPPSHSVTTDTSKTST